MKEKVINNLLNYFENKVEQDFTGHDYYHIIRVVNLSKYIANNISETVDIFKVLVIAYLHDLYDFKFYSQDDVPDKLKKVMIELEVNEVLNNKEIEECIVNIQNISFKGTFTTNNLTIEGKVVQDADRLDAIGAIGIARTFSYGGAKKIKMYDPKAKKLTEVSEDKYLDENSHTMNHFNIKLLKISKNLNFDISKQIAKKKDKIMKKFVDEFYEEWYFNGK